MSNQNPFGDLTQENLEESKDVLGGSFILDTSVYEADIKLAYAGESEKGAKFIAVHFDINGQEYRETIYVTNRKGENFYTKGDKKIPLPGFTTANDLALLSTGKALSQQTIEEKVVKLWDFEAKEELPTRVQAVTSLHGKKVKLAILRNIENKSKQTDSGWVDTNEKRETNSIDKVFHAESGRTVSEVMAKKDEGEFIHKWADKNEGKTRNRFKEVKGGSGSGPSTSGGGAQTTNLFG